MHLHFICSGLHLTEQLVLMLANFYELEMEITSKKQKEYLHLEIKQIIFFLTLKEIYLPTVHKKEHMHIFSLKSYPRWGNYT